MKSEWNAYLAVSRGDKAKAIETLAVLRQLSQCRSQTQNGRQVADRWRGMRTALYDAVAPHGLGEDQLAPAPVDETQRQELLRRHVGQHGVQERVGERVQRIHRVQLQ